MKKQKNHTKNDLDIEKAYSKKEFILKLYRLIKAIESGWDFTLQIGDRCIQIPSHIRCYIEYERENGKEEVEFSIRWREKRP